MAPPQTPSPPQVALAIRGMRATGHPTRSVGAQDSKACAPLPPGLQRTWPPCWRTSCLRSWWRAPTMEQPPVRPAPRPGGHGLLQAPGSKRGNSVGRASEPIAAPDNLAENLAVHAGAEVAPPLPPPLQPPSSACVLLRPAATLKELLLTLQAMLNYPEAKDALARVRHGWAGPPHQRRPTNARPRLRRAAPPPPPAPPRPAPAPPQRQCQAPLLPPLRFPCVSPAGWSSAGAAHLLAARLAAQAPAPHGSRRHSGLAPGARAAAVPASSPATARAATAAAAAAAV